MANTTRNNTFLLKRSNVPNKVPSNGQLLLGELAINTADVKLYASGTTSNSVLQIGWDRIARTGDTMTGLLTISGGGGTDKLFSIKNSGGTEVAWINASGTADFKNINISGFVITGLTEGQVVFANSGGTLTGSNKLTWDNTNGRLGVNTTTNAGYNLDVNGIIRFNNTSAYNDTTNSLIFSYPNVTNWQGDADKGVIRITSTGRFIMTDRYSSSSFGAGLHVNRLYTNVNIGSGFYSYAGGPAGLISSNAKATSNTSDIRAFDNGIGVAGGVINSNNTIAAGVYGIGQYISNGYTAATNAHTYGGYFESGTQGGPLSSPTLKSWTGVYVSVNPSLTNDTASVGIGLNVNVAGTYTKYAALFNGGNVGIGNSAPAYKLDVTGTAGVSSDLAVGGMIYPISTSNSNLLKAHVAAASILDLGYYSGSQTASSGTKYMVFSSPTFSPSGGFAGLVGYGFNPTVSQSGSAAGVTRGLYINPTLTSAVDWRSIEWSNNSGWGLYGAGTASNYLAGNTLIGTTTDSGYKLNIQGSVRIGGDTYFDTTNNVLQINKKGSSTLSSYLTLFQDGNNRTFTFYQRASVFGASVDVGMEIGAGYLNVPYYQTLIGALTSTSNAKLIVTGNITAVSGLSHGVYFNNTLVAAANNDTLIGLDIKPTFTNGAYTGVTNYALRVSGASITNASSDSFLSHSYVNYSDTYHNHISFFKSNGTSKTVTLGDNGASAAYPFITGMLANYGFVGNSNSGFHIYAGSSVNATFFTNGNVGVGTTTDAGYKLDVNGTGRFTSRVDIGTVTGGAPGNLNVNNTIQLWGTNPKITSSDAASGIYWFTDEMRFLYYGGAPANTTFAFGFGNSPGGGVYIRDVNSGTRNSSAKFQIDSTTLGFLPPRMTQTQRNAIVSAATGLVIYQTDNTEGLYEYASTGWRPLYNIGSITGSGATNQVTFWNSSNGLSGSTNFVYDNTTSSLTVGGTTPTDSSVKFRFVGGFYDARLGVYNTNKEGVYIGTFGSGASVWGYNYQSGTPIKLMLNELGGNVLIGTTTDAGQKLQIKGAGTTSSTTSLLIQDSANTHLFSVNDIGHITVSSNQASKQARFYVNGYTTYPFLNASSGGVTLSSANNNNLGLQGSPIQFYNGSGSNELMRLFATGNLILQSGGTLVDAGYKLDVNGDIRGTGNLYLNSTGGTSVKTITPYWGGTTPYGLKIEDNAGYVNDVGNGYGIWLGNAYGTNYTAGTYNQVMIDNSTFYPSAGSGVYNYLTIYGIILQMGGNGITRGLYVNATIASAADWRSIEWTNYSGWGLYGSGSAKNYLNGNLLLGTTTDAGQKLQVNGSMRVGSNSSTAMYWDDTNSRLGIGTSSPTGAIEVVGSIKTASNSVQGLIRMVPNNVAYNGSNQIIDFCENYDITNSGVGLIGITNTNWGSPSPSVSFVSTRNGTGTTKDIMFWAQSTPTTSNQAIVIKANTNRIGLSGITSPTAILDISPSTTSAASLRIRQGTAPTSPNAGDIWFNGTDLYASISGVTKSLTASGATFGTGAAGQVTYWSSATGVTGSTGFTWDDANKRLGIGTSSPASPLHVVGQIRATSGFYTTGTNTGYACYDGSSGMFFNGSTLYFQNYGNNYSFTFAYGNYTANINNGISVPWTINPTSGNGIMNVININPTINQTGGASGVTRGLYVAPTLTSAYDWRSIEWSNNSGWGLYGAGTAKNYLAGNTLIGTTTDSGYKLDVNGATMIRGQLNINYSGMYIGYASSSQMTFNVLNNTIFAIYDSEIAAAKIIKASKGFVSSNGNFVNPTGSYNSYITGNVTATSGLARGTYWDNTLIAAANNDTLVGVDIAPTFTNGAYTGVTNYALRVSGGTALIGTTGTSTIFSVVDSGGTQVASIDSFGTATFKNINISGFGITGLTEGQVVYAGSGNTLSGSSKLTWDNTNGRLGVNTSTSAGYNLDVNGSARVQSSLNVQGSINIQAGAGSGIKYDNFNIIYNNTAYGWVNYSWAYNHLTAVKGLLVSTSTSATKSDNIFFSLVGSTTASSSEATGVRFVNTLVAAANNDTLIGLDVVPTSTVGAYSNTNSYGIRVNGDNLSTNAGTIKTIFYGTSNGATRFIISSTATGSSFNTGFELNQGTNRKWALAAYGTNADFTFYNTVLAKDALFIVGNTNNVLINTTTDSGYKLDVNGAVRIKGPGTTSATNAFVVTNNTAATNTSLIIRDDGTFAFSNPNNGVTYMQGYNNGEVSAFYFTAGLDLSAGRKTTSRQYLTSGSVTASGGIAQTAYFNNTLVAAANNDVLVGLDINPTFTNGAYTGVTNYALRSTSGNVQFGGATGFNYDATNSSIGLGTALTTPGTSVSSPGKLSINIPNGYNGLIIKNGEGAYQFVINTTATDNVGVKFHWHDGVTAAFLQHANNIGTILGNSINSVAIKGQITSLWYGVSYGTTVEGLRLAQTTGNVLINTTTDSGYRLDVNGTGIVRGYFEVSTSTLYALRLTGSNRIIAGHGGAGGTEIDMSYNSSYKAYGSLYVGTLQSGTFTLGNNNTTAMAIVYGNNIIIQSGGTYTDAGYRLDINGTGASTGALRVTNGNVTFGGSTGLTWDNVNGRLGIGTSSPSNTLDVNGSIAIANGQWIRQNGMSAGGFRYSSNNIIFYNSSNNPIFTIPTGSNSTTVNFEGIFATSISVTRTYTHTSSTSNGISYTNSFTPLSGTGIYNDLYINTTINQTGGASGITRGLYINPTLTSAYDWRSVQWDNNTGWGLYGSGTANNYLNGDLLLGTTTDAGYRLDVNGTSRFQSDMLIKGSGNTNATTALTVQNSDATNALRIRNDGAVIVGNFTPAAGNYNNTLFSNRFISSQFVSSGDYASGISFPSNSVSLYSWVTGNNKSYVYIAGQYPYYLNETRNALEFSESFAGSSGSASYRAINIALTINQTGTANGITRGLYINPTLTSAYDWRAIEVTSGATILAPSTTGNTSLRIQSGSTPTTFISGDIWNDGSDVYAYVGGSVKSLTAAGSGSVGGTGATGQVTYWSSASGVTGSTNFVYDNTNSRVGIGTNAPSSDLQIYKDIDGIVRLTVQNNSSAGTSAYSDLYVANSVGGAVFQVTGPANSVVQNQLRIRTASGLSNGIAIITAGSNPISLATSDTERMRIQGNGNVLIGTTTDAGYKLDVNGTARFGATTITGTTNLNGKVNQNLLNQTYFGYQAGLSDPITGYTSNVGLGYQAMAYVTTGSQNAAVGYRSQHSNVTGADNTSIGHSSLYNLISGHRNTAIGFSTLYYTTGSSRNTAVGWSALNSLTAGTDNTAIGEGATQALLNGSYNFAGGENTINGITNGSYNTAIGAWAGRFASTGTSTANTSATSSIYIGFDTRPSATGNTNEIVIGNSAIGNGSNTLILGNTSITATTLQGTIYGSSEVLSGNLSVNGSVYVNNAVNWGTGARLSVQGSIGGQDLYLGYNSANGYIYNNNGSAYNITIGTNSVGTQNYIGLAKVPSTISRVEIGGSYTATGSIGRGTYIGQTLTAAANNDKLFGVDIQPTFVNGAYTNVTNTALRVVGSSTFSAVTGTAVTIVGSGSSTSAPIFSVQGSSGELFSVTDSLTGSLFSVNDISGLPILEAFSDNTVLMGSYQAPSLNTTVKITANSGSTTIYSVPTSAYTGAFFDYTVMSSAGARSGNVMAIWSGTSVQYTETSTNDIGDTNSITFSVGITGSTASLISSATTNSWTVKTIVRAI